MVAKLSGLENELTEDVAFVWLSIDFVTGVQNESQIREYCSMSTAVSKQIGEIYFKEDMYESSLYYIASLKQ